MSEDPHDRAQFKAMTEGTAEDWGKIFVATQGYNRGLADRVLTH